MKALWFLIANAYLVPVMTYCTTGRPRWVGADFSRTGDDDG